MTGAQAPCPTEHQECKTYVDWCQRVHYKGEQLYERVVHIPNERDFHRGHKGNIGYNIARLAAIGVKPGFYDYVILAPFADCGGLYLEAKRIKGGKVSEAQHDWRERYQRFGYQAHICNGAGELIARTTEYFDQHAEPGDWINRLRLR